MASPNLGRALYEASWLESISPVGKLFHDFVQEELRVGSRSTSQQHGGDDEGDLALLAKSKKKTKKAPKGGAKQQQRDMSKVRCFASNKMGNYARRCPNRRRRRRVVQQRQQRRMSSPLSSRSVP
jgi:hypothetical protein